MPLREHFIRAILSNKDEQKKHAFHLAVFTLLLLFNCAAPPYIGRTISSKTFNLQEKNIAIIQDFYNSSNMWFLQIVTQTFINNGYTVMERMQFDQVIKELNLDMTGAVKSDSVFNESYGIFTPNRLKEIGNLYGIKYLVFIGKWVDNYSYLRFIDCENAEVVATTVFSDPKIEKFEVTAADLLVMSVEYSAKVNHQNKKPVYLYMEERLFEAKEGKDNIGKILYQKINKKASAEYTTRGSADTYYLIYTKME